MGLGYPSSPGKVVKTSPVKQNQRISLTIKYDNKKTNSETKVCVKDDSELEAPESLCSSPGKHENVRKEQASVFDWMTPESGSQDDSPPNWFYAFMENFKEELVNEVSTKVVHSLGVVIDNKLSGLEKKSHVETKEVAKLVIGKKKVVKKSVDEKERNEKVIKEAMKITKELTDKFDLEGGSKEIKKLKKDLKKKTDKIKKIAKKIEKTEKKQRQSSLSSSSNADLGINFQTKEDKKNKKKKKAKKSKDDDVVTAIEELEIKEAIKSVVDAQEKTFPVIARPNYPLSPIRSYPVVPVVKNYPLVEVSDKNVSLLERIIQDTVVKAVAEKCNPKKKDVIVPEGKLVNAVFVSQPQSCIKVSPNANVKTTIQVTNMSCMEWTDSVSVQQILASSNLKPERKIISLSGVKPGEEKRFAFEFTAPEEEGLYESVWNFYDGNERFGPGLVFKIIVLSDEIKDATELKDFTDGVEMKSVGESAKSQEMVEMTKSVENSLTPDELLTEEHSQGETGEASSFDLLATEIDSLSIETNKFEEEFEVIPVPACFDLETPFEIVDNEKEFELKAVEKKNEIFIIESKEEKIESQKVLDEIEEVDESERSTSVHSSISDQVEKLISLGFGDRGQNRKLLEIHHNDFDKVSDILFEKNQSDWASLRH